MLSLTLLFHFTLFRILLLPFLFVLSIPLCFSSEATTMADITHLPMEQLQDLECCLDSNPPWAEAILLAFQNYILMLGTSVMIPSWIVHAMGGSDGDKARVIQALLFVAGINTLLQTLFGTRLPTVVGGGSSAYIYPIAYIITDSSLQQISDSHELLSKLSTTSLSCKQATQVVASALQCCSWTSQRTSTLQARMGAGTVECGVMLGSNCKIWDLSPTLERFIQTMRAIQGALIVASSIQIILGYSQVWGLFSRFFSPLGMAPVVGLVGLGLFQRGFPVLGDCVEIGIPMLLLVIGLSQYLKHVRPFRDIPIFERFPVLICVPFVWIYAVILTAGGAYRHKSDITQHSCQTDRANLISTAPWFMFPYPFQWGPPTFSAGHSFAMMSAVIVSMVESTGAYMAASRLAIATPPPAYVLSRGIGWQGIGVLLDGLYGTVIGSTVSVENVGLLGLTRVGSRRVVQISAGFMIFFSILGKFGAVFASIPFPIFAALYCILFGLVASIGISFLQFTNMNSMRNLIIIGLTLFLGISVPQFFNQYWTLSRHGLVHTNAGWFNAFLNTLFSSPPTVGLIVAVLLDNTLEVERSKKDRGMPWWVKFRTFKGDNRNEEFYTLPFNLNRFFPPT
ncbi:Nucleobase-ascorbate transporter 1 [Glycine soja]